MKNYTLSGKLKINGFYNELNKISQNVNLLTEYETYHTIDNVVFVFQKNIQKYKNIDSVYLRRIFSNEKRNGHAKKALKKVLLIADKYRIYITTMIKPKETFDGKPNIPIEIMENWFKREGFVNEYIKEYESNWMYIPKTESIREAEYFVENESKEFLEYINVDRLIDFIYDSNAIQPGLFEKDIDCIGNLLLKIDLNLLNFSFEINNIDILIYCFKNHIVNVPVIVKSYVESSYLRSSFYLNRKLLNDKFSFYYGYTKFSNIFAIDKKGSSNQDDIFPKESLIQIAKNKDYFFEKFSISNLFRIEFIKYKLKEFLEKYKSIHYMSILFSVLMFLSTYSNVFSNDKNLDSLFFFFCCAVFLCYYIYNSYYSIFYLAWNNEYEYLLNSRDYKIFNEEKNISKLLSVNKNSYFRIIIILCINILLTVSYSEVVFELFRNFNEYRDFSKYTGLYNFRDYLNYFLYFLISFEIFAFSYLFISYNIMRFIDLFFLKILYFILNREKVNYLKMIIMLDFEMYSRRDVPIRGNILKDILKRMDILSQKKA